MGMPQEKEAYYSYADVLTWDSEERWELYDGIPTALASPSDEHQRIVGELFAQLHASAKEKPCQIRFAPLDVRLFEESGDAPEDVDVVLQPDLLVVCDRNKIDDHGVRGAPDFIVEVLSPGTERRDRITKFNLYQKAGVREYWIADPEEKVIYTFTLENKKYTAQVFADKGTVPVSIFPGLEIDLSAVFPEEPVE